VVDFIAAKLDEHRVVGRSGLPCQPGQQIAAGKDPGHGQAHDREEGRGQVDVRDRCPVDRTRFQTGPVHDQGDMGDFLVCGRPLAAQPVAVQEVAVVRRVDDQSVRGVLADGCRHAADLLVDKRMAAEKGRRPDFERARVLAQAVAGPDALVFRLVVQRIVEVG